MLRALLVTIVTAAGGAAAAQAATISADVDRHKTTSDGVVRLQITIEAESGYDRYEPPALNDFSVADTGRSTQTTMKMQGGSWQSQSREVYTYLLRPRRSGTLKIGAARLHAQGEVSETPTVVIEVTPGSGSASGSAPSPNPLQPPVLSGPFDEPAMSDEDIFLQAVADRTNVYVGQQVTVSWQIYARTDIAKVEPAKDPSTTDFWVEDLLPRSGRIQWERQSVGGRTYLVGTIAKKALFPLREGDLTVGSLEAQIRPAFGFFNADDVQRQSADMKIHVKPFPQQGRPANFDGTWVGIFEIVATTDRTEPAVGEPVVLRVIIRGQGNVRGAKPPKFTADGWKVYEPKVSSSAEPGPDDRILGEQRLEYVLVPERSGALTIPAIEVPFFDPDRGVYDRMASAPITIAVHGASTALPGSQPEVRQSEIRTIGPDIRPIRRTTLDLKTPWRYRRTAVHRTSLFIILTLAPPIFYVGMLMNSLVRQRVRRDTPRARLRAANQRARKHLRAAEHLQRSGVSAEFFGEIQKVLLEPLSEIMGRRAEGMTQDEIRQALSTVDFDEGLARAVLAELENCDFARFAPAQARAEEGAATLARARDLIRQLERAA